MRSEFFLQISLKFVVHKLVDRILAAIDRILAAIDVFWRGLTVFWRGLTVFWRGLTVFWRSSSWPLSLVVFLLDPSTFVNAKKRTRPGRIRASISALTLPVMQLNSIPWQKRGNAFSIRRLVLCALKIASCTPFRACFPFPLIPRSFL